MYVAKTGNSGSLGEFWRTWNKPVYSFLRQHVYSPLRGRGWSHQGASVAVFLLSAIVNEMMVGIPTHNVIGMYNTLPFPHPPSFPTTITHC